MIATEIWRKPFKSRGTGLRAADARVSMEEVMAILRFRRAKGTPSSI
jgi:hypothetical protein